MFALQFDPFSPFRVSSSPSWIKQPARVVAQNLLQRGQQHIVLLGRADAEADAVAQSRLVEIAHQDAAPHQLILERLGIAGQHTAEQEVRLAGVDMQAASDWSRA